MAQSIMAGLKSTLLRLSQHRQRQLLVISASHLDLELLPRLQQSLRRMGKVEQLDVLLQARGGEVNATRRIALLLRRYCQTLTFIVPYHCQSAATLLTLAGDEIIAGDLALFSPIDPLLHGSGPEGAPQAMSCQDIRRFGALCQDWFGQDQQQAQQQALSLLCQSIFPPTLTAFYRSTQELQDIGEQLLTFQLPAIASAQRHALVQTLMFGYHSHDYTLTAEELLALGLKVSRDDEIEAQAWEASLALQALVGGAARSAENDWQDAMIATPEYCWLRIRSADMARQGQWREEVWQ